MCRGVTDDEIVDAIRRGAFSLEKIARRCDGAGADCGSCRNDIEAHLEAFRMKQAS
jgi:bacterioferritin-associated ferredoxin